MTEVRAVQDELVRRLLARRGRDDRRGAAIPRVPPGTRVPLSPPQAGIWFATRLFPRSNEYNTISVVRLPSVPDERRLRQVLRAMVTRHDALRLRVVEVGGEPVQEDAGPFEPLVTWHDLRHLSTEAAERRVQDIGNERLRTRFRLDQPPLFHHDAVRLPGGGARLVVVMHHIISDGWSATLLADELRAGLAGDPPPPAAPAGYLDVVAWQRGGRDDAALAAELAYWRRKLAGPLPVLELPRDRPRPAVPSRSGHGLALTVPDDAVVRLRRVAEEEGTTPFVVLLAAYKVFLHRLTGVEDLIVGTALAGRDHPVVERMVGCFVKPVALRTRVARSSSFREVVRRVHATVSEAQDAQSVPFEQLVADLGVPRELGVHPVFQTYCGLVSSDERWSAADLFLDDYGAVKWDLDITFFDSPDALDGLMECSADLFDRATLERFAEVLVWLTRQLAASPDAGVGTHAMVPPGERDRILRSLNPYRRPDHPYRSLVEPFEEQVARTPGAVALVGEQGSLTYAELDERVGRLAQVLREAGVGPGTRVALCVERSFELVVSVYAVVRAGAAYVPLEPELPEARLAFMLGDTEPQVVLTDAASRGRVPVGPWTVLPLDDEPPADAPRRDLGPAGPAGRVSHLLYTSGSTGRPKAVACTVDGAVADILWMQRRYPLGPGDAVAFKTSYGFDSSLWEIFWPLYVGARVVVCPPGAQRDPRQLAELIERHQVTMIDLVPTILQVFLDQLAPAACRSLRWVQTGGEPVTPRLRDTFHAHLDAALVNGYGPTEAGCVTDMVIPRDEGAPVVPLGRPAPNFRLYVLDDDLAVLPIGVPGEAFIAGEVGLAHGYHGRPGLTAERFLPDPYGPSGGRMYRTGDLCRYRDDGVLEHLGRIGRQVKVHGMRVEPGEIEAVLCEHDDVIECVAVVAEPDPEQGKLMVAFVVARDHSTFRRDAVRAHAERSLPGHMVPAAIQPVDHIPVNVNGKADHAALLAQWSRRGTAAGVGPVPPADALEAELLAIFHGVLGADGIGVTDGFFASGGHSLLVFKLIAACSHELGVRPRVADVFAGPTVRELARRMRTSLDAPESSLVPLAPDPGRPLLVFVHAASGSALPFMAVADALGAGLSVYALQSPGPEAGMASETLPDLAARYVKAVDSVRGMSPVVLAGWSMGGCVALEMARAWRRRGVDVAGLLMLDTWVPPSVLPTVSDQARLRGAVADIDARSLEGLEAIATGVGVRPRLGALQSPMDGAAVTGEVVRLRAALDRNGEAYLAYDPEHYDGAVDLLYATEEVEELAERLPDAHRRSDRGWAPRLPGLAVRPVPGNHFTLVAAEHAPDLARAIRAVVDERLSGGEIVPAPVTRVAVRAPGETGGAR